MDPHSEPTYWLLARIASVWAMVGITSWSEAASFLAFLYSAWLLAEKFWRSIGRPVLERYGLVKKKAP